MFSFLNNDPTNEINSLNNQRIPVVHPPLDHLPKSAQGYQTNNKYPSFPPLMCDGRCVIASWQPEADVNQAILKSNNIQSNWEYRQYLTNNAPEIMRRNFIESATDVGYYERNVRDAADPQFSPVTAQSSAHPVLYTSMFDSPQHLGNVNTDLKTTYLSREQLHAQQVAPVVTQEELIRLQQDAAFRK
jgi:hypothetical protein